MQVQLLHIKDVIQPIIHRSKHDIRRKICPDSGFRIPTVYFEGILRMSHFHR